MIEGCEIRRAHEEFRRGQKQAAGDGLNVCAYGDQERRVRTPGIMEPDVG